MIEWDVHVDLNADLVLREERLRFGSIDGRWGLVYFTGLDFYEDALGYVSVFYGLLPSGYQTRLSASLTRPNKPAHHKQPAPHHSNTASSRHPDS